MWLDVKDWIVKKVFPDYHRAAMVNFEKELELERKYGQQLHEKSEEIKKLQEKIELQEKTFEMINQFCNKRNKIVLGVEKNKEGEFLIAIKSNTDKEYYVTLTSPNYIHPMPRIMPCYNEMDNELHINDIQTVKEDTGNGSIVMKYFLKAARQGGIKKITGYLSDVDKEHFSRQERYYKKHGFTVMYNKKSCTGSIELVLEGK